MFRKQEIDLDSLALMEDADFVAMGVALGPRKKLIRAMQDILHGRGIPNGAAAMLDPGQMAPPMPMGMPNPPMMMGQPNGPKQPHIDITGHAMQQQAWSQGTPFQPQSILDFGLGLTASPGGSSRTDRPRAKARFHF